MHSQNEFIKKVLKRKGYISRNYALKNYISRLGARILDLKKEGMQFVTYRRAVTKPNGMRGYDYFYKLQ